MNYKKIIAYLSLLVILLYVITGYGITKSATIEKMSFGLLDKSTSFKVHKNLIVPLVVLLLAHLILACGWFNFLRRGEVEKKLIK